MNWIVVGAAFAALAVVTGAFGTHGLEGRLDPRHLTWWARAVDYHMIHALGLVLLGLAESAGVPTRASGWLLLAGILLFSGSLYLLALGAPRWLGMITPFGGTAFILGWMLLALAARKSAHTRR